MSQRHSRQKNVQKRRFFKVSSTFRAQSHILDKQRKNVRVYQYQLF